jgi:hypothetical protein
LGVEVGTLKKEVVVMLREMSINHLAAMAARRLARKRKKEDSFPIHPPYVPPPKGVYDTPYGKMKVVVWLDKERGRWMVRVKLVDTEFNPALPREVGKELLEKLTSQQ